MARRRLIGDLTAAGVYDATAGDAGLVLSELVSNALRHATPLPGSTVRVSWRLHDDSVKIEVSDGGGPTVPVVNQPENSAPGGRGLGIVDRLSVRWGVRADDADGSGQTTVWAELPLRCESETGNPGDTAANGTASRQDAEHGLVIASSRDA